MPAKKPQKTSFAELYPTIAWFVESQGYITLGRDEDSSIPVFVRALDMGGTVWEGKFEYKSIDDALGALEKGLEKWSKEVGLDQ